MTATNAPLRATNTHPWDMRFIGSQCLNDGKDAIQQQEQCKGPGERCPHTGAAEVLLLRGYGHGPGHHLVLATVASIFTPAAKPSFEETIVAAEHGRPITPYTFETRFRDARATVDGLPDGFRYHDLRHCFASLLISEGLDVKVVQALLRHASAKTTLDTYSHMWPDNDGASRTAVAGVLAARKKSLGGQEKKSVS
ncbi:tyrosine-type recombinase/integrase [Arthrobacter alpinus]|uniref:tyrosine-type recombinase/integrase n=1 Tax=Arthrobacter alpinus TaxID=656366 RepID=UPI0028F6EA75|nr:tyrosine-type recombinase/integrase [Arthrobacter alpinus]